MPRTQHSQSFSVNSQRSRMNQTQRLQEDADRYTKKYQWQRRNLMTLKSVQVNLQHELATLKSTVAKLKKQSQDGEVKLMFTKQRNLQKQIDINDKRYNETMGDIDNIKRQINLLRQQKTLYQQNIKDLQNQVQFAESQMNNLMTNIQASQSNTKMNQNLMLSLKIKNQQDKTNYYRKLTQLNKQLRDPKLNRGSRIRTNQVNAVQTDTATILKKRLTKLIINNKQKVKLIDNYQRNMKVIDEAFTTIKQATGLTDIQEIQNTFIKGQEQNYNLLTYVDVLNQQIDNLVDCNETLRQKNQTLKIQNAQKHRLLTGTPDDEKKRRKIQEMIDSRKKQVTDFQGMLDEVQPLLKQVILKLAGSKFNRENPYKLQQYENSGVTLNDTNLNEYLSQLEEYTNKILIFRGKANNQSNAQIFAKTLLLDQMNPKQFKKKTYDHTQLYSIIDETKDKVKGVQKLIDRQQLEDMARKDLEKGKNLETSIKMKKK